MNDIDRIKLEVINNRLKYNFLKWLYNVINIFCIGSLLYNSSFSICKAFAMSFFPKLSVKSNITLSSSFIDNKSMSFVVKSSLVIWI